MARRRNYAVKNGDPAFRRRQPRPKQAQEGEKGVVPKRKYAILFGYLGTGYHGMQKQVDQANGDRCKTIEGVLEEALVELGGITEQQVKEPYRLQWGRVGRTDKGVHAACQVVTLKMSLGPMSEEEVRIFNEGFTVVNGNDGECQGVEVASNIGEKINPLLDEEVLATRQRKRDLALKTQRERELRFARNLQEKLPAEFEIYDVVKVAGFFDARMRANRRRYEYCLPTAVLRKASLYDNKEPVYRFYRDFVNSADTAELDQVYVSYEDKLKVYKTIGLPWDEVPSVMAAAPAAAESAAAESTAAEPAAAEPAAAESSAADPAPRSPSRLATDHPAVKALSDSSTPESIGSIVYRWRQELSFLRRCYAALDGCARLRLWDQYPEEARRPDFVPPFAPAALLALRPPPLPQAGSTAEREVETAADVDRFRACLQQYVGNHHWYNFTSRIHHEDSSGARFIESVDVTRSFNGVEDIVVVRLLGQSFLLNQIRKMVSAALEATMGLAPSVCPSWLFTHPLLPKKHLHLAPGEGLLLERAFFDVYNRQRDEIYTRMILHHPYEQSHPEAAQCLIEKSQTLEGEQLPELGNPDDIPSWLKILKFKTTKIYPWISTIYQLDDVWSRFLADLSWHPFVMENFPSPIGPHAPGEEVGVDKVASDKVSSDETAQDGQGELEAPTLKRSREDPSTAASSPESKVARTFQNILVSN